MTNHTKYEFSFIASSLRLKEVVLVAQHHKQRTQIDFVNELGNGKSSTGKRMLIEFNKRVETLTPKQLDLLINGNLITQKHIAFLSICKAYGFIRDFIIEVLREKYLVYDYFLTDGDYISFYRRKMMLHPEMEKLTELTESKIRQVTFKILEQANIINGIRTKIIQPPLLDSCVIEAIAEDNPEWLKIFFMSEIDTSLTNYLVKRTK